jgi:hypothetical protein
MSKIKEIISFLTQTLLQQSSEIKHGKISVCYDIHNGRITTITNTTTVSVKEYLSDNLIHDEAIISENFINKKEGEKNEIF